MSDEPGSKVPGFKVCECFCNACCSGQHNECQRQPKCSLVDREIEVALPVPTPPVDFPQPAAPCKHGQFKADIDVTWMQDIDRWVAELALTCGVCKLPFHFVGIPEYGMLMTQPALGVGGTQARLPIAPGALTPLEIRTMQYDVRGPDGDGRVVLPIEDVATLTTKLKTAEDALKAAEQELAFLQTERARLMVENGVLASEVRKVRKDVD